MHYRRAFSNCSAAVRLTLSTNVLRLNDVRDLESLRKTIKIKPPISQTEMGALLAPFRLNSRRNECYTRQYICELERHAKPFTSEIVECVEAFIQYHISCLSHGWNSARIRFDIPRWRFSITPCFECRRCHRIIRLERHNQKFCRRCRRA